MLAFMVAGLALATGPAPVSGSELIRSLLGGGVAFNDQIDLIIWQIRLPRLLMGLLAGGALALCGAVMQGLFRNPLADPGLIGVSSGAALGASLMIVFSARWFADSPLQPWLVPLGAFAAGLLVTVIVYRLAQYQGRTQVAVLLLSGVAVAAIAEAGVGVLNYLADDQQLRDLTFWRMGSLGGVGWRELSVAAAFIVPSLFGLLCLSRPLNALLLGESEARHLGVNVERFKRWAVFCVAMAVGSAVAACGVIGFVGLVVPHLLRLWMGADHRALLPASMLLGGVLLVAADAQARTLVSPAELPIGIVTALIGGPFFIYLLIGQRRRMGL